MTEYKFIMNNSSFKMLVVFSPIFVEDTKITFVYNFVAALMFAIDYKILKIQCDENKTKAILFALLRKIIEVPRLSISSKNRLIKRYYRVM